MLRFFVVKAVNCNPDSFIVNRFASTGTTHIYPIVKDEYIYACREESVLLDLNPIMLLGLYPVTNDPLCWLDMKVASPIYWDDTCLVRSSDVVAQAQGMRDTITAVARRRREGQKAIRDPALLMYNRSI